MEARFEELVVPGGVGAPGIRLFITSVIKSDAPDYVDLMTNPLQALIDLGIPDVAEGWKVVVTLPNAEAFFGGAGGPTMVATIADTETATVTFLKKSPPVTT